MGMAHGAAISAISPATRLALGVCNVPFVPRIEDFGNVHDEHERDRPDSNGVDVSQPVISWIRDETRGRRRPAARA